MSQNSSEHEVPGAGTGDSEVPTEGGGPGSGAPETDESQRPVPQFTEKQLKRLKTPVGAMVVSILALVALTLPFVWLQPRPDNQTYRPQVDVTKTAADAAQAAGYPLAAPSLGEGWHANFARWNPNPAEGVPFWEVGTVTPSGQFLTLTETRAANPTWEAQRAENDLHVGTVRVGGVDWDRRTASAAAKNGKDDPTTTYIGTVRGTTVIVHGTGTEDEVRALAEAAAQEDSQVSPAGRADASRTASPST